MAATTLANLVSYIADAYGAGYVAGTVDSSTTTTIVDDALIGSGLSMVGHQLLLGGATVRRITDYSDITGTITFSPSASAPAGGTTYEVLPIPQAQIIAAIQKAIRSAGDSFPTVRYTEFTLASGTQEYQLAQDAWLVLAVWISTLPDTANVNSWVPYKTFQVLSQEGRRTLLLKDATLFESTTGYSHRIRYAYYALPEKLPTTSSTLQTAEGSGDYTTDAANLLPFVEEMALHFLHEKALQTNSESGRARTHSALARSHLEKAERIRARNVAPRVWRTVRRPKTPRHI